MSPFFSTLITILDLFEFNDFESIFCPIIAARLPRSACLRRHRGTERALQLEPTEKATEKAFSERPKSNGKLMKFEFQAIHHRISIHLNRRTRCYSIGLRIEALKSRYSAQREHTLLIKLQSFWPKFRLFIINYLF